MLTSSRRWIFIVSPFITLTLVYYLFLSPNTDPITLKIQDQWTQSDQEPMILEGTRPLSGAGFDKSNQQQMSDDWFEEDRCGKLRKDMDDVFVVLKTGATEAREKIPVQLRTTLQCVPHYAVFSDYEETIDGVHTYDVLQNITESTMNEAPEFEIYHRLQEVGPDGLTDEEMGDDSNGPFGKTNNPGWKLDKWKFLPMIAGALEIQPQAKWYIFIEADTYMVWPNLVNWLAHLDHHRNYYLGSPMQIGDVLFGYGGAGIILSSRTIYQLHNYRAKHQQELEQMTSQEWAGDCVLAQALKQVHVDLTWAWPMMMTSRPHEIDHFSEAYGRQPWCYPAVSYHHMSPRDIEEMWQFDRGWFKSGKNALLLHGDVYRELVHDRSLAERPDWDNLSPAVIDFDPPTEPSSEACADACSQNNECLQFSFNHELQACKHASTTFGGIATNGTDSGWMTHRVQKLLNNFQSSCPQVHYIFE